jgi:2-polyprenyl-3-methyl-5-hydroxy-6-metoxy-1,4-benzoquinol methylase
MVIEKSLKRYTKPINIRMTLDATGMEKVACPLCSADRPRPTYQVEEWQHGRGGSFYIVRCEECGLLYLNPRPTMAELSHYYPPGYAAYQRGPLESGPWWARRARLYGLDKRCRAVTRSISGGRLLDVGCATGDFLARMRRYGPWELAGVEQDAQAAALGRQQYGLKIHTGRVDEVNLKPGCFDVVTMWDVIEHLPQPGASLRRMAEWLRMGGWLLVRTPDAGSPYARALGRYWAGFDAPRHLSVFDRSSLMRLLTENGFQIERVWTLSGSHALTVLSWRYWLRARGASLTWTKLLGNPVAQVLSTPVFWLIDRLGGALVTIAARRTI